MSDSFTIYDLVAQNNKKEIHSVVKQLKCHVCKRDLSAVPISSKVVGGKVVFLCPAHIKSGLAQLMGVK